MSKRILSWFVSCFNVVELVLSEIGDSTPFFGYFRDRPKLMPDVYGLTNNTASKLKHIASPQGKKTAPFTPHTNARLPLAKPVICNPDNPRVPLEKLWDPAGEDLQS